MLAALLAVSFICASAQDAPALTSGDAYTSIDTPDQRILNFEVQTCKGATIKLQGEGVAYEIGIGLSKIEMRSGVTVLASLTVENGRVPLSCSHSMPYWVTWQDRTIALGRGNTQKDPLLSHALEADVEVTDVSVKSEGKGEWKLNTKCPCVGAGYCYKNTKCTCPPGLTGKYCHIRCPCINGGTCFGQSIKCKCPQSFFGRFCEWPCPCRNSGRCEFILPKAGGQYCLTMTNGTKTCGLDIQCKCLPNFEGNLCQTCACQNGGTCVGKYCKCPKGWVGSRCETKCPCLNGGWCIKQTTKCKCPPTFTGDRCESSVCDCQNGGTCGVHGCRCPPGFIGKKCELRCPCQNGGKCVGKPVRCKCPPQVYGKCCEFKCPCLNGGRCVNVKAREGVQCEDKGYGLMSCPKFDLRCKCRPGWTGPLCGQSSCRCENGGTCVLGKFCICPPMFVGKRCQIKIRCCTVYGDPHLLTFDGARMDFQGSCRYNMASICPCVVVPMNVPSFSVHMKNWRKGKNTKVSWLRTLDVYIGGTRVTLGEKHAVLVNGVLQTLPTKKVKDTEIKMDGKNVRIDTEFGASVSFDGKSRALVCVPETWLGQMCGICGNFDNNRDNDFVTKLGDKLSHIPTYKQRAPYVAQSWRVANRERETCVEEPLVGTKAPPSETWKKMAASKEFCGLIKDFTGPFKTCISKLSKEKVNEYSFACTFDVMEMTPDKTEAHKMACNSLEAFADECGELSSRPDKKWRAVTGCQYQCPEGMIYKEKMSPCPATCADPDAPSTCTKMEADGCDCPAGKLLSGGKCISKDKCGCTDSGNYYEMHETFYTDNCKEKVTCIPGNVTSTSYLSTEPGCTEDETCMTVNGAQKCAPTPVDGNWGEWSEWSSCSAIPGEEGIVQLRTRTCDNPPPENGGKCLGEAREVRQCLPGDV